MVKEAKKKKTTKKEELAELKELLQRTQANFENYRKQVEKRTIELQKMAAKDVIVQLLPILDNFELALKNKKALSQIVRNIFEREKIPLFFPRSSKSLKVATVLKIRNGKANKGWCIWNEAFVLIQKKSVRKNAKYKTNDTKAPLRVLEINKSTSAINGAEKYIRMS